MTGTDRQTGARLRYLSLTLIAAVSMIGCGPDPPPPMGIAEARTLAEAAYVYGYPLVLMEITRQVSTNVPVVGPQRAPMGQFAHMRQFPTPEFTDVVRPNVDTLYSLAWIDLAAGAVLLEVPDTAGRYYLMPMLDAWTNVFASPGTRTTGTESKSFALVGPRHTGEIPEGVTPIRAPTNLVWIVGRTQTQGESDYNSVHAIQNDYILKPLGAPAQPYTPPVSAPVGTSTDKAPPPMAQVASMDAVRFFSMMAELMKANPPTTVDANTLDRFGRIGIVPGKSFELTTLQPNALPALQRAAKVGPAKIAARAKVMGTVRNGWTFLDTGTYGTNYLDRAAVAMIGLGANLPDDAVYPITAKDAAGRPLSGEHRYVIHFDADGAPPVNAFWSLTVYNGEGFLVANPINRYAIGSRDELKLNADGSLDIHIQSTQPAGAAANWLPAPASEFNLAMRLYWPKDPIINGTWLPPAVRRADVDSGAN